MTAIKSDREPRRKVVKREWSGYKTQEEVTLSCGHALYVNMGSRYDHCKTMGCPKCKRERDEA